ncbi:uncharacterized protein RCC_08620 [Ramularia collo-cygni]|uniref:Genetic interactor of prohibitins 3, mitochondrial n=1 Tax=Ramularia collo-cygni TaxID=112498 RepID=A0A2D3V4K2_9PEZI|nr:uncharacterized protein RCC_08620 [Ramularia collo-cygni]CZT22913.1 uncharacterized protein RCC_08620 [Ramularia collo-cygni]
MLRTFRVGLRVSRAIREAGPRSGRGWIGRADKSRSFAVGGVRRQVETTSQAKDEVTQAEEAVPSPQPTHSTTISSQSNAFAQTLPVVCPGCGALSQTVVPESAGFYTERKKRRLKVREEQDTIFAEAMGRLAGQEGVVPTPIPETMDENNGSNTVPICDRCHALRYQSKGTSILHPSMQSIQAIIESSPHTSNHIYHVLDAADFPLSLIPNLTEALRMPKLRTQNRRSKTRTYTHGRQADVSFIITRADLLAPQKEQVDRLMPYLQDVLRDALGRTGRNVRLGSLRCVSAKRGWWTPHVKREIWERGGAGWVVGKVNVGKSALFDVVFPKGGEGKSKPLPMPRGLDPQTQRELDEAAHRAREVMMPEGELDAVNHSTASASYSPSVEPQIEQLSQTTETISEDDGLEDEDTNLLPPAQPETAYPTMPLVSSLPGTTASPIRIPYGKGRGELIDLPGIQRSSLETHVQPEHHSSLVMKSRVTPEQNVLKPGQSLLLGGIIRIKPQLAEGENLIFLAYNFTPLRPHVTGNDKAIAIQTGLTKVEGPDGELVEGPYTGTVENIGTEKAKGRIKSAGVFKLEWDVTKRRTGPLTDSTAGKQKAENLPFVVYSADILIEGVGWVELACQVRSRRQSLIRDALDQADQHVRPTVEVFTPKGKFIAVRKPMCAWLLGGPKKVAKHLQRQRPRMSMSMHRRKEGGRLGGRAPAGEGMPA